MVVANWPSLASGKSNVEAIQARNVIHWTLLGLSMCMHLSIVNCQLLRCDASSGLAFPNMF
jgi:hypothetical protein